MWNIQNKKMNPTPIKRSKSKENLEKDKTNFRSDSFTLTERNYSFKNSSKSINEDEEENPTIHLKKKKKGQKKQKFFC